MKPILALLAAVAALVALLWAWLTRPTAVARVTVDPDDDMAGVQVDVRLVAGLGLDDSFTPISRERMSSNGALPDPTPYLRTLQTGPLGPAA